MHDDTVTALDHGHVVVLAVLDLSSAFDAVDHQTVLGILQRRLAGDWFRPYLTIDRVVFAWPPMSLRGLLAFHKGLVVETEDLCRRHPGA